MAFPCSAYRNGCRSVVRSRRSPIAVRLAEVEDGGGIFKVLNLPFKMSGTAIAAGKRAATLGEHSVAVASPKRPFPRIRIADMVGKIAVGKRVG